MKVYSVIILLVVGSLCATEAARILATMPLITRSHANLVDPFVKELANRGHHVTYLTIFPIDKPGPNITQIKLSKVKEFADSQSKGLDNVLFTYRQVMQYVMVFLMPFVTPLMSRNVFDEPEVKKLIESDERFDLVLGEVATTEAVIAGLAHKYQAPIIALSPSRPNIWYNYMVGNPAPASTTPDIMLPFVNPMNFWERTANLLFTVTNAFMYPEIGLRLQDRVMREYLGEDLPSLHQIIQNTSLLLVNQHYALSFPRPNLPNVIEIGGYHVPEPKKLPADLQKYMDESKHGVILFSLGSHIKASTMSNETIQALIGAFSKLKQDVLWKVDVDLKDLPKNVRTSKWLPQSDILAHPNLKLFITHGGLLSTTEAVHRGVPLVGVPVLADQPANMKIVEALGFGKILQYEDITEESVLSVVTEVLDNPSYKEIAQERSRILKDNIMPPMEKAMFWIEYVLRHKGAPHLRSAAQDLAWYQLYLLDVLAVLALAAGAGLTVQFYAARWLLRKLCGKKKVVTGTKKTN